ncbi:MAG: hypothetical protein UR96_C0003G0006 [candidate division WS6 bacterium GW2011_GWC1_36_11]|uniref:Uncharacterized protein n=1 Tax=candidate division WS6 bacterium GW2011_GWC1_36_11 TaxID=1619090 RepID=A0A0G0FZV2_9BACT|nr:MAG: hypothetical protein UR96_C0003G0006 [candidate division WS6 bacterium GW2011_GWC1_36_11]KKQ03911.1 MAG: hypothetical protein US14_C0030G0005 [candidate division WS6 bacterium GW2011_WS6_36_26]HAM96510.1 hypothetical protein [Patescibacteria group bacterium]
MTDLDDSQIKDTSSEPSEITVSDSSPIGDVEVETNMSIMEQIRQKVQDLTDTHADKFGVEAYETGPDLIHMSAMTILTSKTGTYSIGFGITKSRELDNNAFTQSFGIANSQRATLYRLDIRSGTKITAEYENWLKMIEEYKVSSPAVADTLIKVANDMYRKDSDNKISEYTSKYAETEISDKEALDILSNYTDLQFPPNRHNDQSLEKLRQQGLRLE